MENFPKEKIHSIIERALLRALLGEVNPSLRGIVFDWNPDELFVLLYFFHDGEITDAIENLYSCIECEASTHFYYEGYLFSHDFKVVRIDCPKELPQDHNWLYCRREPFEDPS